MRLNLCLGTAQLGGDYGITNKKGKPSNKEIDLIIKSALKNNIFYFDTANAYGNSETILGNKLNDKNIKLITKFKSGVKDSFSEEDIVNLEKNFKETLKRLRTNKIDSYLLHDSNDLKKGNYYLLLDWLNKLKAQKQIRRIGISIYEESDIENLPLKEIEVIQMPISIYDQRLLKNSFIKKLLDNNISIHIRSIFLQGLLLQESIKWPKSINNSFLKHHKRFEKEIFSKNISLMDASISFIKNLDFPELVLFGITNHSELNNICKSWNLKKNLTNQINFKSYKWDNINDIDPRKWIYK